MRRRIPGDSLCHKGFGSAAITTHTPSKLADSRAPLKFGSYKVFTLSKNQQRDLNESVFERGGIPIEVCVVPV